MQVITHGGNFKFLGSLVVLQNLPTGIKFGSDIRICRNILLFNAYSGNCSLICSRGYPLCWRLVLISLIVVVQAALSCISWMIGLLAKAGWDSRSLCNKDSFFALIRKGYLDACFQQVERESRG